MTKWNELKVKIQMLSKGEQLILLFICAFVVALFPGGSAILAPESLDWDVDGFTARILSPLRDAVVAARPGPARDDLDLLIGRN